MGSGAREEGACSPELGTMPARAFREQLDSLATEYGLLQEENRQLRARLSGDAGPTGSRTCGCDVELQGLSRQLLPEALHLTALPGASPDAQLLEVDYNDEYPAPPPVRASEKEASAELASEGSDKIFNLLAPPEADIKHLSLQAPGGAAALDTDCENSITTSAYGEFYHAPRAMKTTYEDWKRKPIFANADDMKERVRQKLTKQNYNVTDYYKKTGLAQAIARNQVFETITLVVIGLNALWIWIDTDWNKKDNLIDAHVVFQVAEHSFCSYFFAEICIRFVAFNHKKDCLKDAWFVFDVFLVCVMVLETWVMSLFLLLSSSSSKGTAFGDASVLRIFRLLRLLRMGRMARLLRAMPELVILIKGMVAAFRSVFFTLVLLVILLYIFAIAHTQLLRDTHPGEKFFNTVPQSMHTLWLRAALVDEVVEIMAEIEKVSIICAIILDIFILAAALTVMNMLVGVLCEVVSAVAASEREEIALSFVKSKVERIFNDLEIDKDGNRRISKEEFVQIIDNREAARAIQEVGVDVVALVDFAEVFFSTDSDDELYEKEISFAEFMEAVVSLRGSNGATVKDIMDLRKAIMQLMTKFEKQVHGVQELVTTSHMRSTTMSSASDHARQTVRSTDDLWSIHSPDDSVVKRQKKRKSCGEVDATAPTDPDLNENDQLRSASEKLRSASEFSSAPTAPTHAVRLVAAKRKNSEEKADSSCRSPPASSAVSSIPKQVKYAESEEQEGAYESEREAVGNTCVIRMLYQDVEVKEVESSDLYLPGML